MGDNVMALTPYVRIVLRYGAGVILGLEAGDILAGDPDVVAAVALAVAALIEAGYIAAKRLGYAT